MLFLNQFYWEETLRRLAQLNCGSEYRVKRAPPTRSERSSSACHSGKCMDDRKCVMSFQTNELKSFLVAADSGPLQPEINMLRGTVKLYPAVAELVYDAAQPPRPT